MSRNPYDKLAKLREREKDVAEREFGDALHKLRVAKETVTEATERAFETGPSVDTADLWIVADLDRARRFVELSKAESAARAAEHDVDEARNFMLDKKSAADAMTELDTRVRDRQKNDALRRELRELDELTVMRGNRTTS